MVGEWGYCGLNCSSHTGTAHSHVIDTQSSCLSPEAAQYDLAGPGFSPLWQEGLYDLDTWGAGHCHTFNPDTSSYAGFQGQLYAHLGELIT